MDFHVKTHCEKAMYRFSKRRGKEIKRVCCFSGSIFALAKTECTRYPLPDRATVSPSANLAFRP